MCWWISKVDIWCGSPYPAKHLDDLSACRVRKCNDLSHQKYDFFSFKPLKLECYLHIFFVDLANLASKKKQHSIMRKKTSHGCWKIFHTTQWSKYSVYYALSQKCQCSWHHFFVQFSPMDIHIDVITCAYACHAPKNKPTKNAVQWHNTATGTQSFFWYLAWYH